MTRIIPFIVLLAAPVLLAGCHNNTDPEVARRERCAELRHDAIAGIRGQISEKAYEKIKSEWFSLHCKRSDALPPQSPLARESDIIR